MITKNKWVIVISVICSAFSFSNVASAKTVSCDISLDGGRDKYVGPCNYTPTGGGSFEINSVKTGRNLVGDYSKIEVFVGQSHGVSELPRNEAVYQYGAPDGRMHIGGHLKRHPTKTACWVGDYEKICVF